MTSRSAAKTLEPLLSSLFRAVFIRIHNWLPFANGIHTTLRTSIVISPIPSLDKEIRGWGWGWGDVRCPFGVP